MSTTTLAIAHQSATTELAGTHVALSGAVGLITLLIGWGLHHEMAHRHKLLDLAAKALLVAGAVIMFAGPGASTVTTVNNWTVPLVRGFASFTHISSTWPSTFGLLTVIEIPLLALLAADIVDAFRARHGRGRATGGGGTLFGSSWQRVKFYYERYGIIMVGPLTVTLPGLLGYMCAFPFALLASSLGHLVAGWTGW